MDDSRLIESLRAGDEAAFARVLEEYRPSMIRIAMLYVRSRAVAEDVVQDAWVGVLRGIDRFEGRSSLKTWLFTIVANTAKTRAVREARSVPFSSLGDGEGPAVDPDRFDETAQWSSPPGSWAELPERRLEARETLGRIGAAINALPERQREVIVLRDVEGFSAEETCNVLGLTETNQRVILHRARSKVREALEHYLRGEM